jgi:sulfur carrier protein
MATSESISVYVNDQKVSAIAGITIPDLLKSLQLSLEAVIVEFNGHAQTREESSQTQLANGDRLEVVRIVAGG